MHVSAQLCWPAQRGPDSLSVPGSSFLPTHQLGGSAGPESGASLQTFPGEEPERAELSADACVHALIRELCLCSNRLKT